ncbi:MAG: peptidoglycan DD-metalloendopeptidase family protein [Gammaproteobacteria bacterium]
MLLRRHGWLLVAVFLLLCACGRQAIKAPVGDRTMATAPPPPPPAAVAIPLNAGDPDATYHEVVPGDTLYSIAWQRGRDHRQIAKWNHLAPPYTIHAGERLRVRPYPEESATPVSPSKPKELDLPSESTTLGPIISKSIEVREKSRLQPAESPRWKWPTDGPLMRQKDGSMESKQGIDIGGRAGQPVRAAADGRVVYSGSGLVGYGQLIIIKHSNNFLSAYAHNRRALVKEGDRLTGGEVIAEMGSTDTDRPMLHFEIRQDGTPVNPMRYLPPR